MNSSAIRIGEVALRAGVSIDTVRYYERRRLLPAAARTEGGFRLFTPDTVERVRFIAYSGEDERRFRRMVKGTFPQVEPA